MSQKQSKNDHEFLNACWEWAGELGKEHNVAVQMTLTPTDRKGVFKLRARAVDLCDGRVLGVRVQVEDVFPSAKHQTLEGALFQQVTRLSQLLEYPTPLEALGEASTNPA